MCTLSKFVNLRKVFAYFWTSVTLSKCLVNIDNCCDNVCKFIPRSVKRLFVGKNFILYCKYFSKYVIGDKYCNIEIWFCGYMNFSVY